MLKHNLRLGLRATGSLQALRPQVFQLDEPGRNLWVGGNHAPLPLPLELTHQIVQGVLNRQAVALAQPVDEQLAVEVVVFVLRRPGTQPVKLVVPLLAAQVIGGNRDLLRRAAPGRRCRENSNTPLPILPCRSAAK